MSIKVMSHVWEHSQHKGGDLLTLLAIADHADDHGVGYPGVDRLAVKTRLARRQLFRVLKRLEASHELSIEHGAGPHGTNVYTIHLEHLGGDKKTGVKMSPVTKRQVTKSTRGVSKMSPESSFEPSEERSPSLSSREIPPPVAKRQRGTPFPDDFVLTPGMLTWAEEHYPLMDVQRTTDQWVDAMRANTTKYRYTNWEAAWRNGLRFAVEKGMQVEKSAREKLRILSAQEDAQYERD